MKRALTIFSLLATIFASAGGYAAETAFINLQYIVAESELGKQARVEFNFVREKMEAEIKKKIEEMETINSELQEERKKDPIDQKKIAAVIEKLQQKNKEYERLVADIKEELAKKDQELVRQILEKVAPILTELATSRGYAVIFKSAADLAYVAPTADITGEVIERLNQAQAKTPKGKK